MDTTRKIENALKLHQAGELAKAESIYQEILNAEPDNPDASHLLGFLHYQAGRTDTARELIVAAVRINPKSPFYHHDLGQVLADSRRPADAIKSYRESIRLKPDFFEAYNHMGNTFMDLGRKNAAIEHYEKAIEINPAYAEAFNNLGIAFRENGLLDRAITTYQKALDINPEYIEALNNLGHALHDLGQFDEALACYRKMVEIDPSRADAHSNMGNLYRDRGNLQEALACYQQAIKINPRHAMSYNNLGNVFQEEGQLERAITCYEKAIEYNPNFAVAYNNLGVTLQDMGKADESIASYRRALEIQPHYAQACSHLVHQLQRTCAWQPLEKLAIELDLLTQKELESGDKTAEQPFQNISRHADPGLNFSVAKSWSTDIGKAALSVAEAFPFKTKTKNDPKISIGYLSGNYKDHPMAHLMLGLLRLHSREQFRINCYSYGPDDGSQYRQAIEQNCDKFADIRKLHYMAAAKAIYADNIDILVDLVGHTQGSRMAICALRPAPVQVRYLGLAGTTGADFFDYIVTDKIVTPETDDESYSEKFVYMPHCYQVNHYPQSAWDKIWLRKDFNLPAEGFVFSAFHQGYKIDPVIFDTWMNILRQVPGSVLWLQHNGDTTDNHLQNEARLRNIDSDRLIFSKRLPKEEHLSRLRLADLALDTRIVTGAATTSDALWMGVPVVTTRGSHFASNMSASILSAVGMQELAVENLREYERMTIELARDPEALSSLRQRLIYNRNTQPLFDTERFTRNLEAAYHHMHTVFSTGEKPSRIVIDDAGMDRGTGIHTPEKMKSPKTAPCKIALFCGPNDTFLNDIGTHLSGRHRVKQFQGNSVQEMHALMDWSDISWFEWCDGMAVQASKLPKVCKMVCRLHSYEVFSNFPHEVAWENIDCLIFVAAHIKKIFMDQFQVREHEVAMEIVHNGINLDKYRLLGTQKGFNIAYIGYINHKKNPSLLLQCMSHLVEIDPRYKLHIAGEHQELRFKLYFEHMVKAMGLEENIVFHGWVEDVENWLLDKSYILSTSVLESFGYGIAEAMAMGLKPVLHNFIGAKELYPPEYLFNNVKEFGEMVLSAEYTPGEYRGYIENNYTQKRQFKQIVRIIDRL